MARLGGPGWPLPGVDVGKGSGYGDGPNCPAQTPTGNNRWGTTKAPRGRAERGRYLEAPSLRPPAGDCYSLECVPIHSARPHFLDHAVWTTAYSIYVGWSIAFLPS